MSNFPEPSTPGFVPVYQLKRTDAVDAGAAGDGPSNLPLKNLVERTAYLKKEVDDLDTALGGVVIGSTVQAYDNDLAAIAALTTTGIIDRTGAGTATTRATGATGLAVLASADEAAARTAIGAASRKKILAAYNFDVWNPADLAFAATSAPSTGTQIDNDYVTFSNVGGLLTITLDVAGSYFFSVFTSSTHSASYSDARVRVAIGGTATSAALSATDFGNNGVPPWDMTSTVSFSVDATAGQTVTIRPTYGVTGIGTVTQHEARCFVNILYCGS